ncbi:putative zinc-binding protein [Dendrosporobacter sp. 1207_IL3150]|uniref:putative zinc-binding protein n=1 Tax=Dendrosporobacter sp. 1207_IL3150 TaxID=3084054 RepID=UPI002FDAF112
MGCYDTGKSKIIIYTCSGCCNEGEISDKVGRRLRSEGYAQCGSSCLAGIGAGYPRFLKAAEQASEVVSIDGCRMACAKMLLKKAQIISKSYVMTDMGFNETCDSEEFITYACKQIMGQS